MTFKLASFVETPEGKYAGTPDGQQCDMMITMRGGMSVETFASDNINPAVSLWAMMQGWYAQIGKDYFPIRAKQGDIVIDQPGKNDDIVLKYQIEDGYKPIVRDVPQRQVGPAPFEGDKPVTPVTPVTPKDTK